MKRELKTAKENGNRFENYNFENCAGDSDMINAAWEWADKNGLGECNIEIGTDGQSIVRISCVAENNLGYDLSAEEIAEILGY